MNHYHIEQRHAIMDAIHLLSDIAEDQWQSSGFYDSATGRSDMFGWYVRKKFALNVVAFNPSEQTDAAFMSLAAPLSQAIDNLLSYCIDPELDVLDAYQICPGRHPAFPQSTPKERALACLHLIESMCCGDIPPLNKVLPRHLQFQEHVEMRS